MSSVQLEPRSGSDNATRTAFLVVDCESIPDGKLLNMVKYGGHGLSDEQAIEKARGEARENSNTGSDFREIEVTTEQDVHLHYPSGYKPAGDKN